MGRTAATLSSPREGLLSNLEDLSLRASLAAICLPLLVVGAQFAFEAFFGRDAPEDCEIACRAATLPKALFALELGAFFLVPMLALAGALLSGVTAITTVVQRRHALLRSAFLMALGLWAVATAAIYVGVVLPELTS